MNVQCKAEAALFYTITNTNLSSKSFTIYTSIIYYIIYFCIWANPLHYQWFFDPLLKYVSGGRWLDVKTKLNTGPTHLLSDVTCKFSMNAWVQEPILQAQ